MVQTARVRYEDSTGTTLSTLDPLYRIPLFSSMNFEPMYTDQEPQCRSVQPILAAPPIENRPADVLYKTLYSLSSFSCDESLHENCIQQIKSNTTDAVQSEIDYAHVKINIFEGKLEGSPVALYENTNPFEIKNDHTLLPEHRIEAYTQCVEQYLFILEHIFSVPTPPRTPNLDSCLIAYGPELILDVMQTDTLFVHENKETLCDNFINTLCLRYMTYYNGDGRMGLKSLFFINTENRHKHYKPHVFYDYYSPPHVYPFEKFKEVVTCVVEKTDFPSPLQKDSIFYHETYFPSSTNDNNFNRKRLR